MARRRHLRNWNPADHPRDGRGRFADKAFGDMTPSERKDYRRDLMSQIEQGGQAHPNMPLWNTPKLEERARVALGEHARIAPSSSRATQGVPGAPHVETAPPSGPKPDKPVSKMTTSEKRAYRQQLMAEINAAGMGQPTQSLWPTDRLERVAADARKAATGQPVKRSLSKMTPTEKKAYRRQLMDEIRANGNADPNMSLWNTEKLEAHAKASRKASGAAGGTDTPAQVSEAVPSQRKAPDDPTPGDAPEVPPHLQAAIDTEKAKLAALQQQMKAHGYRNAPQAQRDEYDRQHDRVSGFLMAAEGRDLSAERASAARLEAAGRSEAATQQRRVAAMEEALAIRDGVTPQGRPGTTDDLVPNLNDGLVEASATDLVRLPKGSKVTDAVGRQWTKRRDGGMWHTDRTRQGLASSSLIERHGPIMREKPVERTRAKFARGDGPAAALAAAADLKRFDDNPSAQEFLRNLGKAVERGDKTPNEAAELMEQRAKYREVGTSASMMNALAETVRREAKEQNRRQPLDVPGVESGPVSHPQLWHVTNSQAIADKIRGEGFKVGDHTGEFFSGDYFGRGVYLFTDKTDAEQFLEGQRAYVTSDAVMFEAHADVKNPFKIHADVGNGTEDDPFGTFVDAVRAAGINPGPVGHGTKNRAAWIEAATKMLQDRGYDGVEVTLPDGVRNGGIGGRQLLVFDASKAKAGAPKLTAASVEKAVEKATTPDTPPWLVGKKLTPKQRKELNVDGAQAGETGMLQRPGNINQMNRLSRFQDEAHQRYIQEKATDLYVNRGATSAQAWDRALTDAEDRRIAGLPVVPAGWKGLNREEAVTPPWTDSVAQRLTRDVSGDKVGEPDTTTNGAAQMATTSDLPSRSAATRATLKGHGLPETLVYYGLDGDLPGDLVRVSRARGEYDFTSVETGRVYQIGAATKFWAAPAPGTASLATTSDLPGKPVSLRLPDGHKARDTGEMTYNGKEKVLTVYGPDGEPLVKLVKATRSTQKLGGPGNNIRVGTSVDKGWRTYGVGGGPNTVYSADSGGHFQRGSAADAINYHLRNVKPHQDKVRAMSDAELESTRADMVRQGNRTWVGWIDAERRRRREAGWDNKSQTASTEPAKVETSPQGLPMGTDFVTNGNPPSYKAKELMGAIDNSDPASMGFFGKAERMDIADWQTLPMEHREKARRMLNARINARFAGRQSQAQSAIALQKLDRATREALAGKRAGGGTSAPDHRMMTIRQLQDASGSDPAAKAELDRRLGPKKFAIETEQSLGAANQEADALRGKNILTMDAAELDAHIAAMEGTLGRASGQPAARLRGRIVEAKARRGAMNRTAAQRDTGTGRFDGYTDDQLHMLRLSADGDRERKDAITAEIDRRQAAKATPTAADTPAAKPDVSKMSPAEKKRYRQQLMDRITANGDARPSMSLWNTEKLENLANKPEHQRTGVNVPNGQDRAAQKQPGQELVGSALVGQAPWDGGQKDVELHVAKMSATDKKAFRRQLIATLEANGQGEPNMPLWNTPKLVERHLQTRGTSKIDAPAAPKSEVPAAKPTASGLAMSSVKFARDPETGKIRQRPNSYKGVNIGIEIDGKHAGLLITHSDGFHQIEIGGKTVNFDGRGMSQADVGRHARRTVLAEKQAASLRTRLAGRFAASKSSSTSVRGWRNYSEGFEVKAGEDGAVNIRHVPGDATLKRRDGGEMSDAYRERQAEKLREYEAFLKGQGYNTRMQVGTDGRPEGLRVLPADHTPPVAARTTPNGSDRQAMPGVREDEDGQVGDSPAGPVRVGTVINMAATGDAMVTGFSTHNGMTLVHVNTGEGQLKVKLDSIKRITTLAPVDQGKA